VNIAAAMAVLASELEHTAKFAALAVACRADRDTLGGVPLGRVAADICRHPGHLERTIKAVDPRYLYVHKSVVYLGAAFANARVGARIPANGNCLRNSGEVDPAARLEAGAAVDKAAAEAALTDARATLARSITARTGSSSRRRR
jgi:hypothetical protein